jgi:hypothetical protein
MDTENQTKGVHKYELSKQMPFVAFRIKLHCPKSSIKFRGSVMDSVQHKCDVIKTQLESTCSESHQLNLQRHRILHCSVWRVRLLLSFTRTQSFH